MFSFGALMKLCLYRRLGWRESYYCVGSLCFGIQLVNNVFPHIYLPYVKK